MQGFYEQFNKELAKTLQSKQKSSFEEPSVAVSSLSGDTIFEDDGMRGGKGTLMVQVTSANGALPIEGAKVTISEVEEEGGAVIANLVTDRSGRTEKIEIATPLAEVSQQPGTIRPYRNVNIMIEYPGYYVKENINVPVFDKIESIQPVALEPLPEGVTSAPPQITVEYESVEN